MTGTQPSHHEWVQGVVARYERPLTLYAMRFLHDTEASRDVVQEVFMRLCKVQKEDITTSESAWLYTVCRNLALDQLRKDKRMKPSSPEIIDDRPGHSLDPADKAEASESHSLMLKFLSALPDHQQEVIRLKFQHNMSYREIAQVTQMSVSNVGYLIHTGLASLRKQLA
jgi:RNA polymerase sigma factor (sigma-70 family)